MRVHPAIISVREADTMLHVKRLARRHRAIGTSLHPGTVIRMARSQPTIAKTLDAIEAGQLEPTLLDIQELAALISNPEDVGLELRSNGRTVNVVAHVRHCMAR